MTKTKPTQTYTKDTNQKGQALLFVVVAMTIALTVGINASVRTITSLSRTARTDTATRALAAAEGGIERFLELNTQKLEEAVEIPSENCPVGSAVEEPSGSGEYFCMVQFNSTGASSGEVLTSQALVQVERYDPDPYIFEIGSGQVKEINLQDLDTGTYYDGDKAPSDGNVDIDLCWDPTDAGEPTDLLYLTYDDSGVRASGGLSAHVTGSPGGGYDSDGFVATDFSTAEFQNCKNIELGDNTIYGIRIRSLGGISRIGVYGTGSGVLPLQGYEITSVGRISEDIAVTATRKIKIIRTLPYLPASFDFAIYSQNDASFD